MMQVIEYQHRGMPHAHIVLKLSNMPGKPITYRYSHQHFAQCTHFDPSFHSTCILTPYHVENVEDIATWIDGTGDYSTANISCRLPPYHSQPATAAEWADNMRHDMIKKHMVHKCAVAENGCKKTATTPCKRGFDNKPTEGAATSFDPKGKPVYKRCGDRDSMIVSHNIHMLMDWDGHLNVEYAAGAKSVMYLYDYLFKGKGASFPIHTLHTHLYQYFPNILI
jgi:hypothetical protein